LQEVDASLSVRITSEIIDQIVALIPDGWLGDETEFANHAEHRAAYVAYLSRRLESPREFVEEAIRARA
jgi:hypothetical protein